VTAGRAELAHVEGRPFELAPGALAAFTSRLGGISAAPFDTLNLGGGVGDDPAAVAGNRRLAAQLCGRAADRTAWMRQVHGSDVVYAAGPTPAAGTAPVADALFTDVPDLALGVLVADCAPVLIADPEARIIGAAHAGREGMAAGVVLALVHAMTAGDRACHLRRMLRGARAAQGADSGCSASSRQRHDEGQPGHRYQGRSQRAAGRGRRPVGQPRSAVHGRDPGTVFLPARRPDRSIRRPGLACLMIGR